MHSSLAHCEVPPQPTHSAFHPLVLFFQTLDCSKKTKNSIPCPPHSRATQPHLSYSLRGMKCRFVWQHHFTPVFFGVLISPRMSKEPAMGPSHSTKCVPWAETHEPLDPMVLITLLARLPTQSLAISTLDCVVLSIEGTVSFAFTRCATSLFSASTAREAGRILPVLLQHGQILACALAKLAFVDIVTAPRAIGHLENFAWGMNAVAARLTHIRA